jgi:uncharacterized protein YqhQ
MGGPDTLAGIGRIYASRRSLSSATRASTAEGILQAMSQPFYYGGQAVMEGVMMRGRKSMAVAVRAPDGRIVVYEQQLEPGPVLRTVRNIPFVRGAVVLWDTLKLGMQALMFSANVGLQEEDGSTQVAADDDAPGGMAGPLLWATVGISVLFSIGLFFVLPLAAIHFLDRWIATSWLSNLIEGVIRLAILVGYMALIARFDDIRRVFAYHGAEHKTINAYEAELPVNVANVRTRPLEHVRCGTGFLLIVVLLSIFVFMLLGRPPIFWRIVSRIVLVPVIAALAYEIIRFGAAHAHNAIVKLILAPGLALQRITTREPDDAMLEVAIAAFKSVLATDAVIARAEVGSAVISVDQTGRPLTLPPIGLPLVADGG